MFTELKESMIEELKGSMMIILHQIKNINKEIEIVKNRRTKWKLWSLNVQ